jgi:hypothetical protein
MMFHIKWNMVRTGTTAVLNRVSARLPEGWSISRKRGSAGPYDDVDAVVRLTGPDGHSADMVVECKKQVDPRDVPGMAVRLRQAARRRPALVWADFLGPRTRELLEKEGLSFADATGNLRVSLSRPAVFLQSIGADRDPRRSPRALKTLKGRAAGRAVRALCDFTPPYGVRELADRSGTALASLARVAALLEREALVTRNDTGRIIDVKVADLIRRWSRDYGIRSSNTLRPYLAPRGLDRVAASLRGVRGSWCITGSLAAARRAAVAPARLAVIYTDDAERLAEGCELRDASEGAANVLLADPYDPVVFERTWTEEGLRFAALPQVAVDLLTGPGRGPAEAEELLGWMESHVPEWRA